MLLWIYQTTRVNNLGSGGIAKNWYRLNIPIPNNFEFDEIIYGY